LTAAIVTFVGTGGALVYWQRLGYRNRKRRAKRAVNGARKEVVVLAGPPASPATRSLMLDLERRGFIVYVLVGSVEEEAVVIEEGKGRPDVRAFMMDLGDPVEIEQALQRFQNLLLSPHHAFAGAAPHELNFVGLVLVPDLVYPSGPIETLSPELWSDTLNTKVLGTVATAQAFLPSICEFKARILVLTPNVVASLKPAFHGMESTIVGALDGFTTTLRRELSTLGISVCQLKLGNFDFSHLGARTHLQSISATRIYAWPASARLLYAQNFINQGRIAEGKGVFGDTGSIAKSSSPRELHHAVFDALTQPSPRRVWRVGRGSLAYDLVGNWVPGGIVGWILGLRSVSLEELNGPQQHMEDSTVVQSWEKVERTSSPGRI